MKPLKIIGLMLLFSGILWGCQANPPAPAATEPPESPETPPVMEKEETMEVGTLTTMGRASVKINLKSGQVIYIDPYGGTPADYTEPADLVLVTHQHGDHNKVELVTMKEGGRILQCPTDIKAGDTVQFQGIDIMAVPAYNKNHPKEESTGYVLKMDGITFYHSGDTSNIPEMADLKALNIDYALVCMDGFYNMGPAEAMKAVETIAPKHVIPIHTSKDELYNQENVDAFTSPQKIVLKPGESMALVKSEGTVN